jgi:RNA polymerase sigma factor (sigma-70 family)
MEVSAIRYLGAAGAHGRSPLLRLQSDERLVALVRRGNHHAFEALVARYESRLLAFCRHMLSSREDAEDVLQEVFAAAFHAMLADDRPINVRPWLYRIARNRSLNHLRRVQPVGVDSMDTHFAEHGLSTAEKAHRREDFRLLIADVQDLPETQRTALLLREIDALSYEQIAEAMDNTVPSVKSLLVRARLGLAEAAEARMLDCDLVRFELGEVAEGLKRISPPVRRHVRTCEQCAQFRKQLADTNRQLAALLPVGPLLILKKTLLAQLGSAAASGGSAAAGSAAGGALQVTFNAAAGKAAAGLAAAAIVTAGAVEAKHVAIDRGARPAVVVRASAPSPVPASAPVPASNAQLTPAAPALDPFAAGGAPMVAGVGEHPSAPAEDAANRPGERVDETIGADRADKALDPATDAAGSPLMADLPGALGAPADSFGRPPSTPVAIDPAQSPALIEGVARPADAAAGTPVTGIVGPNTAGKGAQPVVEALPPAENFKGNGTPVPDFAEPIAATEGTRPRVRVPIGADALPAALPADDVPARGQQPEAVVPAAPADDAGSTPDRSDESDVPVAGDDAPAAPVTDEDPSAPAITGRGAPAPAVGDEDASGSPADAQEPPAAAEETTVAPPAG